MKKVKIIGLCGDCKKPIVQVGKDEIVRTCEKGENHKEFKEYDDYPEYEYSEKYISIINDILNEFTKEIDEEEDISIKEQVSQLFMENLQISIAYELVKLIESSDFKKGEARETIEKIAVRCIIPEDAAVKSYMNLPREYILLEKSEAEKNRHICPHPFDRIYSWEQENDLKRKGITENDFTIEDGVIYEKGANYNVYGTHSESGYMNYHYLQFLIEKLFIEHQESLIKYRNREFEINTKLQLLDNGIENPVIKGRGENSEYELRSISMLLALEGYDTIPLDENSLKILRRIY